MQGTSLKLTLAGRQLPKLTGMCVRKALEKRGPGPALDGRRGPTHDKGGRSPARWPRTARFLASSRKTSVARSLSRKAMQTTAIGALRYFRHLSLTRLLLKEKRWPCPGDWHALPVYLFIAAAVHSTAALFTSINLS